MATLNFFGTGSPTDQFVVDDIVVIAQLFPGELRMQEPFPYPTLDMWRRHALTATASITDIDTQGRTTLLFAHEADMNSVFFPLTAAPANALAGHYNYKRKASLADKDLLVVRRHKELAYKELKAQRVPDSHINFIRQRVESATFNHRVTGVCAAVYLTALLLEEAEAIE